MEEQATVPYKEFLKSLDGLTLSTTGLTKCAKELQKQYDMALEAYPDDRQSRAVSLFTGFRLLSCFEGWKIEKVKATTKQLVEWIDPSTTAATTSERDFVGVDFGITGFNLTHTFDLEALWESAYNVLTTYYSGENQGSEVDERYHAPYFCFIQSSGMGKTKLLYEMKRTAAKIEWNPSVKLILCRPPKQQGNESNVFDAFLELPSPATKSFADLYNSVGNFLNQQVTQDTSVGHRDVLLLFDEAHYLTDTHNDMKAFWFRVIRLWLRFRNRACRVVAVFAGTNSKITNFTIEDDVNQIAKTDTRNHANLKKDEFRCDGKKFFETFYKITTVGCLRNQMADNSSLNEYERSVLFGRPLFAAMLLQKELTTTATGNILKRMLLLGAQQQDDDWSENPSCCLNILATRVQMGQTTAEIASDLVGSAYANLVGVDKTRMRIYYPPDPVCARLAMCLMDEGWSFELSDGRSIRGLSKASWVRQISVLFSNRIFTVEKGDFGEVLVTLYFLLCADECRGCVSKEYQTFAVPLETWIESLYAVDESSSDEEESDYDEDDSLSSVGERVDDRETPADSQEMQLDEGSDNLSGHRPKRRREIKDAVGSDGESMSTGEGTTSTAVTIYFNAIQVCRNYLRGYASSWKSLCDQDFLRNIYHAAVGFYVFGGCATIDCVFSLARKEESTEGTAYSYIPMLVSIKSHDDFTEGAAKKECTALLKKAKAARPKNGALCLLVVFGADRRGNDREDRLDNGAWMDQLCNGECIARVLRIPRNDRFGISDVVATMTSVRDEMTEILTSHCFVGYDDGKLNQTKPPSAKASGKKTRTTQDIYASQSLRKSSRKKKNEHDEPARVLSKLALQLNFGKKDKVE